MEDRLQKFARLTEIGSFTKAAKILHISQPALSISIDKLEQELNATLLLRDNRKFELTEAGKAAYAAALEHQNTTDTLEVRLNRIKNRRPAVSIGMTDSVATVLCATAAFDALERMADVTLVVNNSRYLRESMKQRQLDVAFVIDDGIRDQAVVSTELGIETLVLVCRPNLLERVAADLQKGRLSNFISYDKPSTTYHHVQQALQTNAIKPIVSLFSTSPEIMLSMALQGRGVCALPLLTVQQLVQTGQLAYIVHNQHTITIQRPICLLTSTGKTVPGYVKTLKQAYLTAIAS